MGLLKAIKRKFAAECAYCGFPTNTYVETDGGYPFMFCHEECLVFEAWGQNHCDAEGITRWF